MCIERSTMKSLAVFSDDEFKTYRYLLSRIWDKNKKVVTVIMLNPSVADTLKSDRSVMNVTNYFIDYDNESYGKLNVVNLYSYRDTNPKNLKNREEEFEKKNDDYILRACEKSDTVVIGWTRGGNIRRKRKVAKLIEKIDKQFDLKCFMDKKGVFPRHPAYYSQNSEWKLIDYDFSYIDDER